MKSTGEGQGCGERYSTIHDTGNSHPQVIWPDSLEVEKPGCEAKVVLVSGKNHCAG